MVKIRRAYEVLFLGLFLFVLMITDLWWLPQGLAGLAVSGGDPARRRRHGPDDADDLPEPRLGPVHHRWDDDAGPRLVQLDVPLRHPAPPLRLDRQPPEHEAGDRGEPVSQDLRDQVLHPRGDARDGQPLDHPHHDLSAPGRIYGAYTGRELTQGGVSCILPQSAPASARPPRNTSRTTPPSRSASSTPSP